jgi:hypothetical protein
LIVGVEMSAFFHSPEAKKAVKRASEISSGLPWRSRSSGYWSISSRRSTFTVLDLRPAAEVEIANVSEPPGNFLLYVVLPSPARGVCGSTFRLSAAVAFIAGSSFSRLNSETAASVG